MTSTEWGQRGRDKSLSLTGMIKKAILRSHIMKPYHNVLYIDIALINFNELYY